MATQNAVAKKKDNAVALAAMYEEDVGGGFENADKDSYALPMLNILQKLSPQVDESEGKYIAGAKAGMMFNNVTDELYSNDTGLTVVPCGYRRSFIEWKPRGDGGGFVKEHSVEEAASLLDTCYRNDKNQDELPNGNILADTRTHYVMRIAADGSYEPGVIAMSSTQMKKSKKWMSRMQNMKMARADGSKFTPPMYAHTWKLTTVPESNDKGSWSGWKLDLVGPIDDPDLFAAAKEFKALVATGEVEVRRDEPEVDTEVEDVGY